jgi:hypothetical protein
VSNYLPGSVLRVSMGGLDDGVYNIIAIATKTAESTTDAVPQQGVYESGLWKGVAGNAERVEDVQDAEFEGHGLGLRIVYEI